MSKSCKDIVREVMESIDDGTRKVVKDRYNAIKIHFETVDYLAEELLATVDAAADGCDLVIAIKCPAFVPDRHNKRYIALIRACNGLGFRNEDKKNVTVYLTFSSLWERVHE